MKIYTALYHPSINQSFNNGSIVELNSELYKIEYDSGKVILYTLDGIKSSYSGMEAQLFRDTAKEIVLWLCEDDGTKIGEVSPDAIWIKVGDKVLENMVELENASNHKSAKYLEIGDKVNVKGSLVSGFELEGVISKIEPIVEDEVDWSDGIHITNLVQPRWNKEYEESEENDERFGDDYNPFAPENLDYEPLHDTVAARENVQFLPTRYYICKIKCSQCETYH